MPKSGSGRKPAEVRELRTEVCRGQYERGAGVRGGENRPGEQEGVRTSRLQQPQGAAVERGSLGVLAAAEALVASSAESLHRVWEFGSHPSRIGKRGASRSPTSAAKRVRAEALARVLQPRS